MAVIFCSLTTYSWADFNGRGIWCEFDNSQIKNNGKGFFFFDNIKVGSFDIEQLENHNNIINYIDLSIYETNKDHLNWETLIFDNYSKEFTTHYFELNANTMALSLRVASSTIYQEFNCKIYPEWKLFLDYIKT